MRKALAFATLALLFLAFVAFALSFGHAATTSKKNQAFGLEAMQINPNAYLLASVSDATVIEGAHDDLYTNVRFSPYGTPLFYDETVLFCGNEMTSFEGKRRAIVIVYRKVASTMFKGIACHDLEGAFEVTK